jgi:phosphoribosylanthranilate isomerase
MTDLLAAPRPWIKICGVTRAGDAALAVELGATAIGVNFWPRSPRCVEADRAREIVAAVAGRVPIAGVFVDEDPARIEAIVAATGIDLIQLHGDEPVEIVARFAPRTICAARLDPAALEHGGSANDEHALHARSLYPSLEAFLPELPRRSPFALPLAFLLDGPTGARRGGTGEGWDWSLARPVVARCRAPVLIAGGIRPGNARRALETSGAAGVDVASGVESSPGVKDAEKMRGMMEELRRAAT